MNEHLTHYRIRIQGSLDHPLPGWPEEMTVMPDGSGETLLESDFIDQPALRGFLDQLWNLNFTVLAVEGTGSTPGGNPDSQIGNSRRDVSSE